MIIEIALLCGLVVFSAAAIIFRDLLRSAICLAVASLLLGIIFFRMKAPYIGAFEISVVAGLITVLFIVTIALTKTGGDVRESKVAAWIFPLFFLVFLVIYQGQKLYRPGYFFFARCRRLLRCRR